jgi:formate C-acetyltransferase
MVFEEKMVSFNEFKEILEDDWVNNERLRQYALNFVPKWCNDDDYVDDIAVQVADHFFKEVVKYKNPRGGKYYPGIFTFHHVSRGIRTSASPDGRHAGDPFAAHLSPQPGSDKSGPTSTLNSALKVYGLNPPEGTALDIRFHPTTLTGEEGLQKLADFIKVFMKQGGTVVQFNVVDSKTLRKAQLAPEQYRSLLVRVWGFSAYFTTLAKEYQDELIQRTEHELH